MSWCWTQPCLAPPGQCTRPVQFPLLPSWASYLPPRSVGCTPKLDTEQLQSGTHSTNNLWAHNYYFVKIFSDFKWKIMIHYGHNFAHVTTAELSWHVQNHDLVGLLRSKLEQNEFTRFQLWAHELFAKWPPGSHLNRKMLSHQYM